MRAGNDKARGLATAGAPIGGVTAVRLARELYGVADTIWRKRRTWLNIVLGGLLGSFAVLAGASVA